MATEKVIVSVPAMVVGMSPKQDRSWKLVFETRELAGEEVKILADNYQGEGWLLFKPNGTITEADLPIGDANAGMRTPSQRLRSVMMVYHRQHGIKTDPNAFYATELEKIIDWWKGRLDKDD